MIIGLLAKTAILITEYAAQRRQTGMSIEDAAFDAAKVRLRPILMTVLTMIFGMLPLLYASGAGANGNRTLGAGVVGGMIIGTIALLFIVPPLFIIMQRLRKNTVLSFTKRKKNVMNKIIIYKIHRTIVSCIFILTMGSCGIYETFQTPRYDITDQGLRGHHFPRILPQQEIYTGKPFFKMKNYTL